ncbi:MAG: bifunctional folylpolyglutamate synthase/dihydrofolate synthase [Proteobacteria bacterium]|nr:bifunctional folylpolyglutamate synthase/dihydrofolate synthase [Desulfobacteraceae bacterium]MBU3980690.1 bifunctional folylpolyglutamate synthase/dihydrofolate synthase [Pseudomonadota bacterium]MBU4012473.1 bifunctional folylpolyglutamate synthase/dihydrofolate synthase [Pseudomonadota bacterium]MBU4069009.1 bifunctional folylpolyglutamate synthase/dihydrofolate synthase [Pseudomonadota bacterium]MBU4101166.1 bifunctional folylpolyglutamate synthase/dihydrofolate synthase [Pseudomonadota 
MYGLRRFGIKLGLSTIKSMMKSLGNPQKSFLCIHVAGTNGKGSIASSLASILKESNYKVGLFTSPHLVRFNERIQIDNKPVSNKSIVEAYEALKNVSSGNREPTFFEYSTAMAFYEFGKQKVDWAVIETGMGGRLDATNIIKPALTIISNISLEHRMYLGNTIKEIAGEKGGIIKNYTPVVTGARQKSAVSTLKDIALEKSAPFYRLGEDFKVRRSRNRNNKFTYYGIENTWHNLHTGLQGDYQIDNAAIVLAACELLDKNKAEIPLNSIQKGLENNHWPGRLEIVSDNPLIILDGAHNLIGTRKLVKYLAKNLSRRKITLVAGILDDKPYSSMIKTLCSVCHRAILTQPRINRALLPEKLYSPAKQVISDIKIIPKVNDAIKYAIKTTPKKDAICIAGSLYLVGEAIEYFEKNPA